MADTVSYRPRPAEIPARPGVYRFRDNRGRVLYVGKAKNLRNRLANYFAPLPSLHERTRHMVTTATSVEWTVVTTEFEALQLEFSWIKEFNPPFNVQFRDDKSYPYLAITLGEDVPRVLVTRKRDIRDARYFGPYTKVWALRETVDLMLKAFPMRSCSDSIYRRAEASGRPCLLGDIGKCAAPCVGRISKADHKSIALDFASFMAGNDRRFLEQIETRMRDAAERQDYEAAARYRDQLQAMQTVLTKNSIVLPDTVDADLIGLAHDELAAAVQLFSVRGGRIRGVRSWVVDKELDITLGELVETVLRNSYDPDGATALTPPRLVVVPELPDDTEELQLWLGAVRRGRGERGKVTLRVAQRGDLAALASTAGQNAQSALISYKTKRSADFTARSQALTDLQDALGMSDAPLRIECFDVSHLGGTNIVASMVVFEDGLPRKDLYRKFSVTEAIDDTDAMHQVLTRRLAHLDRDDDLDAAEVASVGDATASPATPAEPDRTALDDDVAAPPRRRRFAYRPHLLIVDGGLPQVNAAQRALDEAGVTDIILCGIAKRLEELWRPGQDYPVILSRNSDALFLVQRIRDEAHRFALSFQRQRRRRDISTTLSEVPGLGPARVKVLLRHFGSVAKLRAASAAEIDDVPGIGPVLAQAIHDHLHNSAGAQ